MGQTVEKNDSVLQGSLGPDIHTVFPLVNDSNLNKTEYPVIYPLLVVNNIPIKDKNMIDCFRNHFDRAKIAKMKLISKRKAEKKGIPNVPDDGALLISTKRGYYFDFSCDSN